ncbi:MAG: YebC/PmpR family DNA-binding transcriptional regulator [Gammaproteobacteria bacterium]|nr:YebC/PmpR family DNA-binding transcriptional regulator [Gammaproteobacteria bacterium]
MAGHSKWANIRFRKGAQDARRGKLFTKLIREITAATRLGGEDPAANPRLRTAIDKAMAQNMPKDNVERAIKRGTGDVDGVSYEDVRYEGFGPGGVAILVECTTDNRNRTVGEVRHAFTKHGGNLGTDGSVAYLFSKQGMLSFPADVDEEAIMEAAISAGAEDVVSNDDGTYDVITTPQSFEAIRDAMQASGFAPEVAEVTQHASTGVPLSDEDAEKTLRLLETLEDLDDAQNVYTNADFPEELAKQQQG